MLLRCKSRILQDAFLHGWPSYDEVQWVQGKRYDSTPCMGVDLQINIIAAANDEVMKPHRCG